MKKLISLICFILISGFSISPVFAVNVGTYKTESEYGLLDGFKFNWKRTDKSQPFIQPREESSKKDYEKEYQYYKDVEYERTKYMYEGRAIF